MFEEAFEYPTCTFHRKMAEKEKKHSYFHFRDRQKF